MGRVDEMKLGGEDGEFLGPMCRGLVPGWHCCISHAIWPVLPWLITESLGLDRAERMGFGVAVVLNIS